MTAPGPALSSSANPHPVGFSRALRALLAKLGPPRPLVEQCGTRSGRRSLRPA
jgi:hypothetical protein